MASAGSCRRPATDLCQRCHCVWGPLTHPESQTAGALWAASDLRWTGKRLISADGEDGSAPPQHGGLSDLVSAMVIDVAANAASQHKTGIGPDRGVSSCKVRHCGMVMVGNGRIWMDHQTLHDHCMSHIRHKGCSRRRRSSLRISATPQHAPAAGVIETPCSPGGLLDKHMPRVSPPIPSTDPWHVWP